MIYIYLYIIYKLTTYLLTVIKKQVMKFKKSDLNQKILFTSN